MQAGRARGAWAALVRIVAVMALLWLHHPPLAAAQDASPEETIAERRVKAAYLYRFAGYTEWPDDVFARPDSALVIGVWGNDELADDLAKLVTARTVAGRRFEVRKIHDGDPLAGLHLLYVSRDHTARASEAVAASPLRGLLVVTDSPGALRQGGAVNFLATDGQIRFELSLEAAEKRGLKLSSRLAAVSTNLAGKGR